MAPDNNSDDLERALRDERRHRVIAQHRLAKRTEEVAVWRRRADERAERNDRLTAGREKLLADREQMIIRRDALLERIAQLIARRDKLIDERARLRREREVLRAERDEVLTILGWPKVVVRRVAKRLSLTRRAGESHLPAPTTDGSASRIEPMDQGQVSTAAHTGQEAVSLDISLEVDDPIDGEPASSTPEALVHEIEKVPTPPEVEYGDASRSLVGLPRFPSFSVLPLGVSDPTVLLVLDQFNVLDVHDDPTQIYRADFVIVGEDGVAGLSADVRDLFETWEQEVARQPLLWLPASTPGGEFGTAGSTLRIRCDWAAQASAGNVDWAMPTPFDPTIWSPAARVSLATMMSIEGVDSTRVHDGESGIWISGDPDLSVPWMLSAAAAGVPFSDAPPDAGNIALEKKSASRRRAAFAWHAPWVIASQLLDRMGFAHRGALPPLTGVLISNRPRSVVSAIEQFSKQSYGELSLVVGCHGFSSEVVAESVEEVSDRIPVTVLEFGSRYTLGRCLNEAIASSTGAVIAKIDDDDHYGPGYLEDSVQAMLYSGSALVGKMDGFVYLESEDTTYRRRATESELYVHGFVLGPTMVFKRSLWEAVSFSDRSVGEDTAFQTGAANLGVELYAASRWEFVYRRSLRGNTWSTDDKSFTLGSTIAWAGDEPCRSDLDPV